MTYILDTSSLLALVRYYLIFDKDQKLKTLVEEKIASNEFVVIDKVVDESRAISKGIILNELTTINQNSTQTSTILPNKTFFNQLDNQFCNRDVVKLKKLSALEFDSEKTKFLETADAKMILYAIAMQKKSDTPIIVTEETVSNNDGKIFKKIPACCKEISIQTSTLPELFKNYLSLSMSQFLT